MKWCSFMPALIFGIILSNPPIVAIGAGVFEGGRILLGIALLGVFLLAILTGWLNHKQKLI
jgi:hypothetical protein